MTRPGLLAFFAAATLSGLATLTATSQARLTPGSDCTKLGFGADAAMFHWEGAFTNASAGSVVCPYPDYSGDGKSSVTDILADVLDGYNAGSITIQACSQPFGGGSLHCGGAASSSSGGTGNTTVQLTGTDVTNAWGSSFNSDYGSLRVLLPRDSILYGFTS